MTLQCEIECTRPVLVARFTGVLRLAAAPSTFDTLTKLLSDQPDALVIDLSATSFDDPRALLAFGVLAYRASMWPGVPVILAAPDEHLRDTLRRLAVHREVAVCADRDEAMLLAHGAPVPRRLRERLQSVPGAARRGRDLATEACLRWGAPDLIAPASMIVSELVSNAVRHTGRPFDLVLTRTTRYLHLSVYDESQSPAVRQDSDPLRPGGQGLLIVERTALSWGSMATQAGKVVWATLPAR